MLRKVIWNGKTIAYELTYKKVKNINLRINREGEIHVSAPRRVPQKGIDSFILEKAGWILQWQQDMERRVSERNKGYCSLEEGYLYLEGQKTGLSFIQACSKEGIRRQENGLEIQLSSLQDMDKASQLLSNYKTALFRERLKGYLDYWIPLFQERFHIPTPEIRVKELKSRWGSCSNRTHTISFNSQLIHLPTACLEYVVVHELAHFIYPNHSKSFHGFVEQLLPGSLSRRRLLKEFGVSEKVS